MKGILAFSILFLLGAIYNLVKLDFINVVWGLIISGVLFGLYLLLKRESRKSDEFISWITYNQDKIIREGAVYQDILIDKDTQITQFQVCLSFLIFTTKIPTRFYIKDHDNTIFISLFCTFISLIGGWWGLPWGPIYTVQVVIKNIVGGNKRTIAAFFNNIDDNEESKRREYAVGRN
jgi:hypothetical protein